MTHIGPSLNINIILFSKNARTCFCKLTKTQAKKVREGVSPPSVHQTGGGRPRTPSTCYAYFLLSYPLMEASLLQSIFPEAFPFSHGSKNTKVKLLTAMTAMMVMTTTLGLDRGRLSRVRTYGETATALPPQLLLLPPPPPPRRRRRARGMGINSARGAPEDDGIVVHSGRKACSIQEIHIYSSVTDKVCLRG